MCEINQKGVDHSLPATDWQDVQAAGDPSTQSGQEAIARIMSQYQPVLLAHLQRKFKVDPHEAEDFLQSFVQEKALAGSLFSRAKPERGRFRTFLLKALDNFMFSELRHQQCQKRHPLGTVVPIQDVPELELPHHEHQHDDSTELVWARAVIAGALLNMRAELARRGRLNTWHVFEHRILRPLLGDEPPMDYDLLIERFGFGCPSEAFNVLVTAKRMFRRHLESVVREYASNDHEAEAELAHLRDALRKRLHGHNARA